MSKQGIIFDMDGTLWDSSEGVARAWSEVVAKRYTDKRVITAEELQSVMGKTMDKLAEALFPELEEAVRMELLQACCEEENEYLRKNGGVLYDGLESVLQILQQNYPLYIVSNCQSGYIEAFLSYYQFEKYFEDIECYGNNGLGKCDNIHDIVVRNNLDDAIYVGDIQADYDASKKAGAKFIHAAYGFGTIQQEVPAINTLSELSALVSAIFYE